MSNIISQHWTMDQDKLESYVLNKLGKKEKSVLDAHLAKCEECSRRVKDEQELRAGIRRFSRMEMKRRLKQQIRRDQGRRFEWTHVASLAAAIVVMLAGVFSIRWFIDVRQGEEKVREIVLSESKESRPADNAMWIIGKVVEIKDEASLAAGMDEDKKSPSVADNFETAPVKTEEAEIKMTEKLRRDSEPGPAETQDIAKEAATSTKSDAAHEELKSAAAPSSSMAFSRSAEQNKVSSGLTEGSGNERQTENLGSAKPAETAVSRSKGAQSPEVLQKLGYSDTIGSGVKSIASELAKKKYESDQVVPSGTDISSLSDKKFAYRPKGSANRRWVLDLRKRRPAKNVIVRRGDFKDLPADQRIADPSAIQTKMERTSKGVLLTFYSAAIKDTTASFVEAVTSDSIIVFFRNKQIAYRIPGGLGGS